MTTLSQKGATMLLRVTSPKLIINF